MSNEILDDHGLEIIRKSGKRIDGNVHLRVYTNVEGNTFNAVRTEINNSTAVKINVPGDCRQCILYHVEDAGILWLGKNKEITADSDGTAPFTVNFTVLLDLVPGNDNNLFGISTAGTFYVYAIGMAKE